LEVPDNLIILCKETYGIHKEIKDDLRIFMNKSNINPSEALLALDLFNNILFDIISKSKGYKEGDFGSVLNQMQKDFPIAYQGFKDIHDMRCQKTLAHYKNKDNSIRIKIKQKEYNKLIDNIKLDEVYNEIFEYFSNLS
jgi:hypothetical protein